MVTELASSIGANCHIQILININIKSKVVLYTITEPILLSWQSAYS